MIIIEGMDNTGKSTLLEALINIFPMLKPQRMTNAPGATHDEYRKFVWDVLSKSKRTTQFMVFDRLLYSEVVYGPIVRGYIRMGDAEMVAAFQLLKTHDPLLIYCDRTEEQIRSSFGEREQMNGVEKNVGLLLQSYESWIRSSRPLRYDFEDPKGMLKVVGAVADYIRKAFNLSWTEEMFNED